MRKVTLDKFVPGITKEVDEVRYDPCTENEYRHTEWDYRGHTIEVNADEYGYHARVDDGPAAANMDQGGLVNWVFGLFGR